MLKRLRTFLWLIRTPVSGPPTKAAYMCTGAAWDLSGDPIFLDDATCKWPWPRGTA